MSGQKEMNEIQKFLEQARNECLNRNPMDMEMIDRIIREENCADYCRKDKE